MESARTKTSNFTQLMPGPGPVHQCILTLCRALCSAILTCRRDMSQSLDHHASRGGCSVVVGRSCAVGGPSWSRTDCGQTSRQELRVSQPGVRRSTCGRTQQASACSRRSQGLPGARPSFPSFRSLRACRKSNARVRHGSVSCKRPVCLSSLQTRRRARRAYRPVRR